MGSENMQPPLSQNPESKFSSYKHQNPGKWSCYLSQSPQWKQVELWQVDWTLDLSVSYSVLLLLITVAEYSSPIMSYIKMHLLQDCHSEACLL